MPIERSAEKDALVSFKRVFSATNRSSLRLLAEADAPGQNRRTSTCLSGRRSATAAPAALSL